jgi:hypothetical protein
MSSLPQFVLDPFSASKARNHNVGALIDVFFAILHLHKWFQHFGDKLFI